METAIRAKSVQGGGGKHGSAGVENITQRSLISKGMTKWCNKEMLTLLKTNEISHYISTMLKGNKKVYNIFSFPFGISTRPKRTNRNEGWGRFQNGREIPQPEKEKQKYGSEQFPPCELIFLIVDIIIWRGKRSCQITSFFSFLRKFFESQDFLNGDQ